MGAHGEHDMGHTVAGWTGSVIVILGSAVAGVALVAGSAPGLWAGGLVVALGAVVTWLLHLAGWGKPTGPRPPEHRHWRTPDPAGRRGHPDCLGCRLAGRNTDRLAGRDMGRNPGRAPVSAPAATTAPAPAADRS